MGIMEKKMETSMEYFESIFVTSRDAFRQHLLRSKFLPGIQVSLHILQSLGRALVRRLRNMRGSI